MNYTFQFGTPSLQEWHGKWKSAPTDNDADRTEHFQVYEVLTAMLISIGREGSGDYEDFYFRGDFTGDRTQVLEIVYPPKLTLALLGLLRDWIKRQRNNWRIIIPTYIDPRDALVIYADQIRYAGPGTIIDEELLRWIIDQMMKHKDRGYARRRYEEEMGHTW